LAAVEDVSVEPILVELVTLASVAIVLVVLEELEIVFATVEVVAKAEVATADVTAFLVVIEEAAAPLSASKLRSL
jgi:hypothetical protein